MNLSYLRPQTKFAHPDIGIICLHRVQPASGITDEKFVVALLFVHVNSTLLRRSSY